MQKHPLDRYKYGPEKKYRLCPGVIRSINDGEFRTITCADLARLYGVELKECVIGRPIGDTRNDLIELHPQFNGDYRLPQNNAHLHH